MSCADEINISTTIIQENIDVTATPIDEVVDINISQITEVIELSLVSCEHVVNIISGTTIDPANYDLADFQNANANYFIRLNEFVTGLDGKVDKVIGETLIPITALDKLNAIEDGAQVNIIESINVNGVELVVNPNKSVDIIIPDYSNSIQHDVKLAETIGKGQAVYVSGASGTNILVKKASNATEATSSKTLGLLVSGGVLNDIVKVATEGLLSGLNTSAATIGDPVWLGTNGNLIFGLTNKPIAPAHLVYLGVVTRVNANNGEIFVHVQNGFELNEIHDVLIQNKLDQQGIYFNASSGLWQNGWNWFQYASGFQQGTIPTLLSDVGGVQKFEYTYTFGTRYRKISSSIDGFYTDLACTDLIIKKEL